MRRWMFWVLVSLLIVVSAFGSVDLGDQVEDSTIYFYWSTNDADGAAVTRTVDGTICVYKDNGTTEITAGITDTEDFDTKTGIHLCTIVMTDAAYTVGNQYSVILDGATIDEVADVRAVLARFTIEHGQTQEILDELQDGTYGIAQLVRATTPANTLDVDADGRVDVDLIEGSDATDQINAECDAAFATYDPPTYGEMAARTHVQADYFDWVTDTVANVTEVAELGTQAKADVEAECGDALVTYDGLVAADTPTNWADLDIEVSTGQVDIRFIEGVDATNQLTNTAANVIVFYELDHLVYVAEDDDPATDSIMAKLVSATGNWSTFDESTDSLEAISGYAQVCDASNTTFTPVSEDCWDDWGDPGEVDDALTVLCSYVEPLLPPAAPVLDNIDWDSSEGVSGKNTWNAANPITGYTDAGAADSDNNSGDALDITMDTSGNEHGVIDYDSPGTKSGTLNEDVPLTDNYPANAFGPGGSDGGDTNTLYLVLNDSTVHSVDLLTFESGNSLNGNGSGFTSLLDDTPVTFDNGDPFSARTYRTGGWTVVAADMEKGYNVIWTQHTIASGSTYSDKEEFLLDDDNTATSFGAGAFASYPGAAGTKDLSGVTYHNGTVTATYTCAIDDGYRNTFRTGTAVTHPTTTYCSCVGEALANSAGDEAKQVNVSQTATVDYTRITGANMVVNSQLDRTVQTDGSGGTATQSECLVDRDTQSNNNTSHYYADEGYRIRSNQDFNTNLTPSWDETESLVDAGSAGYNDGVQITEDRLYCPGEATVDDYSSLSSGPAGNPDYSTGVSGVRYYFGQFYNATGCSNFSFNIQGSATLVDDGDVTTDTNQVSIVIRLPSETGWMCINQDYAAGQWGSTSESATATATVGCYAETYGADKTIPTSGLGWTVGVKTTDDSYDKVYYRVTIPQGWTGYIESIAVTWGA